jgi:hypothetical protein
MITRLTQAEMNEMTTERLFAYYRKLRKTYQIYNQMVDPEYYFGMTLEQLMQQRVAAKQILDTRENISKK